MFLVPETATIANPNYLNTTVSVTDDAVATLRLTVATQSGCSPAIHDDVVLTVTDNPTIFNLSSTSLCTGGSDMGTVTLSNSQGGVSYQLQDGGNNNVPAAKTGTGSALIWTNIGAGTYHVVATANGGCNSTTGTTVVSQNPIPNAPSTTGASRCGPGSIELTASGCDNGKLSGMMLMGMAANEGTPFDTSWDATTSFFVSCSNGGCESERTEVKATINQIPAAPILTVVDNCGGTCTINS